MHGLPNLKKCSELYSPVTLHPVIEPLASGGSGTVLSTEGVLTRQRIEKDLSLPENRTSIDQLAAGHYNY
jgi:hypothetical protein